MTAGSVHIAFAAPDRETVDAFHAAAVEAGGVDNGRPGLRPHYHSGTTPHSFSTPMGTTWKLSFTAITDVLAAPAARASDDSALRPGVWDTHLRDMREVGRRRELEDELAAPAYPRVRAPRTRRRRRRLARPGPRPSPRRRSDVRPCLGRRQDPDARQDLRLAVVLDVRRARKVDPLPHRVGSSVRASASSRRCTWIGRPGKRRLPPQWSKWRCVLTTTATRLTSSVRERVRVPLLAVLFDRRRRVDHPRVDEDEPVGMLDRVGEPGQAVTGEDHFARQVPTDIVTAEHGGRIMATTTGARLSASLPRASSGDPTNPRSRLNPEADAGLEPGTPSLRVMEPCPQPSAEPVSQAQTS